MKARKQSATLAAACMFAGTCTAAMAGSQSALDPANAFYAPVPIPANKAAAKQQAQKEAHSLITPTAYQEAETTTTSQYVKMPGMETAAVKPDKKKAKVAANSGSSTNSGGGLVSGVNDKFKSARSGILGGTRSAGGGAVKGAKAAGEGIASGTMKVGGGIASGTMKMGGGIASGAKASGSFFIKGAHAMGSGLKAATSSIPGFGHSNKAKTPAAVVATAATQPGKGQATTVAADKPASALATPIAQQQQKPEKTKLAALKPEKIKHEKDVHPENVLVHEKATHPEDVLVREKVKKFADPQLATNPGIVGKTINKLTFWKHKDHAPSVQATASKDDPGKIVR